MFLIISILTKTFINVPENKKIGWNVQLVDNNIKAASYKQGFVLIGQEVDTKKR